MIILEHTAQPLAADNFAFLLVRFGPWKQDLMVHPLMRAFPVIMDHEFVHGLNRKKRSRWALQFGLFGGSNTGFTSAAVRMA